MKTVRTMLLHFFKIHALKRCNVSFRGIGSIGRRGRGKFSPLIGQKPIPPLEMYVFSAVSPSGMFEAVPPLAVSKKIGKISNFLHLYLIVLNCLFECFSTLNCRKIANCRCLVKLCIKMFFEIIIPPLSSFFQFPPSGVGPLADL